MAPAARDPAADPGAPARALATDPAAPARALATDPAAPARALAADPAASARAFAADPSARVRALAPGQTFAGCRLDRLAGHGEMGLVYRAIDLETERPVAVKVIKPELAYDASLRARFAREAGLAVQIRHAHLIPVLRAGEEEGIQFMVMGFVVGVPLDDLRRRHGRFPPAHATRLVGQIAAALDAVHAQGFVHRDVKPGNVLVTGAAPHEHLYLTDFGLAKRMAEGSEMTGIGGYVGTPDYIPPEQVNGDTVDARSDVYALGCLLYELLTGTVPFPRDNHLLTIFAHLSFPVPAPSREAPEIPAGFDRVIARAMSKEPAERYRSASDLARAARLADQVDRPGRDGRQPAS